MGTGAVTHQPALGCQQRHRTATLYRGDGGVTPFVKVALEVTVTNGAPTGQVFNGTTSFQVPTPLGPRPAVFIFDSQTGDITGWNPANGATAVVAAHSDDAIYTGLALLQTPSGPFLLAADFRHARIDVFDGNWNRVNVGSAFTDPACRPATHRSTCRSWARRFT